VFGAENHRPPRPPHEELLQLTPTALTLVFLAASVAACADEPSLRVQVCSDLSVPGELDAVRVVVFDAQRKSERFASVFELIECPAGRLRPLPQVLEVPSPGSAAWLRVEGLHDGIAVVSAETRLQPGDGESRVVPVSLEATCRGVTCPLGQTCLADGCAPVPYHSEAPMRCVGSPAEGDADADAGGDAADAAEPDAADAAEPDAAADSDVEPGPVPDATSLCAPTSPFLRGGASP
jgi:hypothetical protein